MTIYLGDFLTEKSKGGLMYYAYLIISGVIGLIGVAINIALKWHIANLIAKSPNLSNEQVKALKAIVKYSRCANQ